MKRTYFLFISFTVHVPWMLCSSSCIVVTSRHCRTALLLLHCKLCHCPTKSYRRRHVIVDCALNICYGDTYVFDFSAIRHSAICSPKDSLAVLFWWYCCVWPRFHSGGLKWNLKTRMINIALFNPHVAVFPQARIMCVANSWSPRNKMMLKTHISRHRRDTVMVEEAHWRLDRWRYVRHHKYRKLHQESVCVQPSLNSHFTMPLYHCTVIVIEQRNCNCNWTVIEQRLRHTTSSTFAVSEIY